MAGEGLGGISEEWGGQETKKRQRGGERERMPKGMETEERGDGQELRERQKQKQPQIAS